MCYNNFNVLHTNVFQKYPSGAVMQSSAKSESLSIDIGTLRVEIVQGDLTKQRVDAIVNSCNKKLNLKKGISSYTPWTCLHQGQKVVCIK